jgi:hypothetical protein
MCYQLDYCRQEFARKLGISRPTVSRDPGVVPSGRPPLCGRNADGTVRRDFAETGNPACRGK